jgi:diguanylate cyclase (GGDEF)-like protein/PAS domain S-box-containing protein
MTDDGAFFKDVLDHLYDGVYFVDVERRITYWNKGAERISGYAAEAVVGRPCHHNILAHVDESGCQLCQMGCPLAATIADGQTREAEVYLRHAGGHRVPVMVRVAPLRGPAGEILGAVESFSDNSLLIATRRRADQFRLAAEQDALTGLGNRRYLERRLEACLREAENAGLTFAIFMLDIDHFKHFNDTYGHAVGDEVLKMAAETLRHSLRATDFLGRWGGEEFMVVALDVDAEQLAAMASKLRALVANSGFMHAGARLRVTLSIGGTVNRFGDTFADLVGRADELLYQSKASGRNRATVSA